MLLGYSTDAMDGSGSRVYRTMWIALSRERQVNALEVAEIVVPRSTGFWRLGVTRICEHDAAAGMDNQREVVWQVPIDRPPVVSQSTPCKNPPAPDGELADESEPAGAGGTRDVILCDNNTAGILFVSPGCWADQYTRKQTDDCEPRGGRSPTSDERRATRAGCAALTGDREPPRRPSTA